MNEAGCTSWIHGSPGARHSRTVVLDWSLLVRFSPQLFDTKVVSFVGEKWDARRGEWDAAQDQNLRQPKLQLRKVA
jgi:hypothetical protein